MASIHMLVGVATVDADPVTFDPAVMARLLDGRYADVRARLRDSVSAR
ncbi:MAG: hypothetical protein WAK93_21590 [Solirubrobacteraceae bacterium]